VITPEQVLFGCDDGGFFALNKSTGELMWKTQTDGPVRTSPLVTENAVYFGGQYLYKIT
jgi:outer membrane protein assembly factor BamB